MICPFDGTYCFFYMVDWRDTRFMLRRVELEWIYTPLAVCKNYTQVAPVSVFTSMHFSLKDDLLAPARQTHPKRSQDGKPRCFSAPDLGFEPHILLRCLNLSTRSGRPAHRRSQRTTANCTRAAVFGILVHRHGECAVPHDTSNFPSPAPTAGLRNMRLHAFGFDLLNGVQDLSGGDVSFFGSLIVPDGDGAFTRGERFGGVAGGEVDVADAHVCVEDFAVGGVDFGFGDAAEAAVVAVCGEDEGDR